MKGLSPIHSSAGQYRSALRIALVYLVLGSLWIMFSDHWAAAIATSPAMLTTLSLIKGWAYVFVTALLLYGLIGLEIAALRSRDEKVRLSFSNAMEIARLGYWEYDVAGDLFTFNDHFYAIFRTTAEQVGGYTMSSAQYAQRFVYPEDIALVQVEIEKAIETTEAHYSRQLEHRIVYPDGETGYVSVRFFVIKDDRGRTVKTFGANQDITERKKVEETLQRKDELLHLTGDMAKVGGWEFDAETLTGTWTDEVARIHDLDPQAETNVELGISFYSGASRRKIDQAIKAAIESAKPYDLELEMVSAKGAHKWVRTVGLPVMQGNKVIKVKGIFQDISDRKFAELGLRESAENLAMAQRISHFGSWEMKLDKDLKVLEPHFWSDECYHIYGYEPGSVEITEKFVLGCLHPEDAEIATQVIIDAIQDHQEFTTEYRIVRPNGSIRFIYEQGKVILDEQAGQPVKIIGSLYDITEPKKAEEALKESEERFHSLYENSTVGIYRTTPEGRVLLANPALLNILGYASFGELSAKHLQEETLGPSYDRSQFIEMMEKQGEVIGLEAVWTRVDGAAIYVRESARAIRDEQGRILYYDGIVEDITQQKRAEEAVREGENRYRSLFENMLEGYSYCEMIFEDNLPVDYRYIGVNPAFESLTGLKNVVGKNVTEVLPGIRESSPELFEIYGRVSLTGVPEKFESHVATLGKWFSVSVYSPEKGRFIAVFDNITERKNAEEALMESEERYRTLAEAAEDSIFILNPDDTFQYVNHSGARLLGRQPGDLIGRRRSQIFPLHISDPQKLEIEKVFQYGVPSMSESLITTPNGEAWVNTSLVPIRDNDGKVSSVLGIARDITERKWAEEALREKERQMQALVTSLDDIVFEIDARGTYLNIWSSSEELLVQPRDSMLGQTVVDMLGEVAGRSFIEIYEHVLATGQTENIEHIIDVAGGPHWFQSHISPIRSTDGTYKTVSVFVRDITARKRAEDSLRKRTEELALLQEAGRELSSTLDLKEIYATLYRYIAWSVPCDALIVSSFSSDEDLIHCQYLRDNNGEQDVSGFPPIPLEPEGQGTQSQVIRSGSSLLLPDYETYRSTSRSKYYTDDQGSLVEEIPDDADRPRSAILVPLTVEGLVAGVLQVFSYALNAHTEDHLRFVEALVFRVTAAMSNAVLFQRVQSELLERRRAEDEVRKLNAELEQRVAERTTELSRANSELKRASRAKDEFLASMSHELRTPLNTILTLGESLQEGTYGALSERQIKPLHTATESGYHLLNLINDILDLSKIEAGKMELKVAPVEIEPLCQASSRLVMQQAQNKRLQFSLDIDPGLVTLNADARALKQMLVNLLSNAVKFTPEGGKIGLEVRCDAQRGAANFTVWDTGIGIAPEPAQHLFQPFVQIDSGLARQYGGTGLGLSLVYRMAEMHGGGVSLESTSGKGSRFTISLPWRNEPQASGSPNPAHAATNHVGEAHVNNGRRPVILIAEDNLYNQTNYNDYLSVRDYQVIVAANGIEAINCARERRPDLILMDIQMPGMDGLEVTRHLRADPELSQTPIIALTALAMPGDRERCLAAGANEYLAKPVSLKQLTQTIDMVLGKG